MSALLLRSLAIVCPSCDLYNPPGAQRCSECGTVLQESAQPRASAAARAPSAPAATPAPPAAATPAPTPRPPSEPPRSPPPRAEPFPPGMRPASRPSPPSHAPAPAPTPPPPAVRPTPGTGVAPPGVAPIPASELVKRPQAAPSRFGLTVLTGHHAGQRFRLGGAGCMVGRTRGAILFPDDVFVSPHHGTFILREGRLFVRDEGSVSGVYVSLSGGVEAIQAATFFAAGQRLFRFLGPLSPPPPVPPGRPAIYGAPVPASQTLYALEEVIVGGRPGRTVVTAGSLLTIGQQHCDLSYPGDESLASRHCELSPSGLGAQLRDLSGGAGTFVRLVPGVERALHPGDRVRIGQQVLQVDLLA